MLDPEPNYDVSECEPPEGGVCDNWRMTWKNSQLHPIIRFTSGNERQSRRRGVSKTGIKRKFWELRHNLYTFSRQFDFEETDEYNKHQDLSLHFLDMCILNSISELHEGQKWTETSDFWCFLLQKWFKFRLWCMNWWWQVFRITKRLNQQVRNKQNLLATLSELRYQVNARRPAWSAGPLTSTYQRPAWSAGPLTSTYQRPAYSQLGHSPVHIRDQHGQLGHSPVQIRDQHIVS